MQKCHIGRYDNYFQQSYVLFSVIETQNLHLVVSYWLRFVKSNLTDLRYPL